MMTTNPVRMLRLTEALNAYREQHNHHLDEGLTFDVRSFLALYGFTPMADADVRDFWLWFCNGRPCGISHFTREQILWGIEKFLDEFSPVSDDVE
jgi:hypothetical protein